MKSIKTYLYLSVFSLSLTNCQNCKETPKSSSDSVNRVEKAAESPNQNANQVAPSESASGTGGDQLMVETPKGYYAPNGLKKLNLMEMYKLGTGGNFKKTFPLKDKDGNEVTWKIMENPEQVMFLQMYANDQGEVVQGVVFPVTDEIKAMIMKVRIASAK